MIKKEEKKKNNFINENLDVLNNQLNQLFSLDKPLYNNNAVILNPEWNEYIFQFSQTFELIEKDLYVLEKDLIISYIDQLKSILIEFNLRKENFKTKVHIPTEIYLQLTELNRKIKYFNSIINYTSNPQTFDWDIELIRRYAFDEKYNDYTNGIDFLSNIIAESRSKVIQPLNENQISKIKNWIEELSLHNQINQNSPSQKNNETTIQKRFIKKPDSNLILNKIYEELVKDEKFYTENSKLVKYYDFLPLDCSLNEFLNVWTINGSSIKWLSSKMALKQLLTLMIEHSVISCTIISGDYPIADYLKLGQQFKSKKGYFKSFSSSLYHESETAKSSNAFKEVQIIELIFKNLTTFNT